MGTKEIISPAAVAFVIAFAMGGAAPADASNKVPRGYTLIQVSYDNVHGLPLPIKFWAESGHRYSPPETKLPPKTDAETWLHLERRGEFLICEVRMRASNHNSHSTRKSRPWVATELQFFGADNELLHTDIISTSMRFYKERTTDWKSCTFSLPVDKTVTGVRLRHKAF